MSISIKNIINQNVKGKSVLLRADFNIPMFGGEITDTSRIKRLIPTIEFLKNSGAKVIICSHLGRPDGEFNEAYSLKPLLNKLSEALNIEVKFVESCIGSLAIKAKESLKPGEILLLENVRFHKGETYKVCRRII
jgi:phosphoglycerate kinase